MATLPPEAVRESLKGLPGWSAHGATIEKQFTFASFPDAVAFVVRLSFGGRDGRPSSRYHDQLQTRHAVVLDP